MINSIPCFRFLSTYFDQSKLTQKVLGSLITIIFSSIIIMIYLNCCKRFSDFIMLIQRYSLISFCNFHELLPAFICRVSIGSLVNNLFGVKFFNPVSVVFLFGGFNFVLSAILLLHHLLMMALVVKHLYLQQNQE